MRLSIYNWGKVAGISAVAAEHIAATGMEAVEVTTEIHFYLVVQLVGQAALVGSQHQRCLLLNS